MGWIISAAMVKHCKNLPSLPEQAAESLAGICLDGKQSAPLSGSHTPQAYLSPDKMRAFSRLSRYGMTFKPLMDGHGGALLTSYLADSRARILASPEKEQASTVNALGCGGTWHELSMKYDRDSHSWKTHRHLFTEDLPESSVTLPKSGMIVDGVLWEQTTWERRTEGKESGFWPTPCSQMAQRKTIDGQNLSNKGVKYGLSLIQKVRIWPTPSASDNRDRGNIGSPAILRRREKGKQIMLSQSVSTESGALNPDWVEKLMGWPSRWASLDSISHVEVIFWILGFMHEDDKREIKILRLLREGNAAKEIQGQIGRFVSIPASAFLLSKLCKYANRLDEARLLMACAETLKKELRSLRGKDVSSGAPYRSEERQQSRRKHPDIMQKMSRFLAFYGKAYWEDGRWENAEARVAHGVPNRPDRLKAIGNGQVPAVAAAAFRYLSQGLI